MLDHSKETRSTQKAQTSLAEADHYFHNARCMAGEPQCSRSLPASQSGHATAIMVLFVHLLILENIDQHQNVISSSLYHPGSLHKISSQSVRNF